MKTKLLSGFLLIILITSSCSHNKNKQMNSYEELVPDSVVCSVINNFVNDTLFEEFKRSKIFVDKDPTKLLHDDSIEICHLDTIFSKEDLEFIFLQNRNAIFFNLHSCLKNKILISADTLQSFKYPDFWTEYRKRYGKAGFCSIGLPLFSKKLNLVIIKYSYSCGGLCGSGGTYIFKKIDGKWEKLFCIANWIS